jgi:hypothetical protein
LRTADFARADFGVVSLRRAVVQLWDFRLAFMKNRNLMEMGIFPVKSRFFSHLRAAAQ